MTFFVKKTKGPQKAPSWLALSRWPPTLRVTLSHARSILLTHTSHLRLLGTCQKHVQFTEFHLVPVPPARLIPKEHNAPAYRTTMSALEAVKLRKKYTHFRILVIGRANAGKTTLLKRVCNTDEDPCIYNKNGENQVRGHDCHGRDCWHAMQN